jgi:hypothetical protein
MTQLLAGLRAWQIEQARTESNRGNDLSALGTLEMRAAASPDAGTRAEVWWEEANVRYHYAKRLVHATGSRKRWASQPGP